MHLSLWLKGGVGKSSYERRGHIHSCEQVGTVCGRAFGRTTRCRLDGHTVEGRAELLHVPVKTASAHLDHSPRKWYKGDSILVKGSASRR
jgi:hypothetical protein